MGSTGRSESKVASIEARLKYETEQAFIEKYASNITRTGIFVKTANPRPVGTRVKFEFQIADGTPVLRGLGEVEWMRREASPNKPPGMNIKFIKIDSRSRMIIERIAEFNRQNRSPSTLPSILPEKSHPGFKALMSSLESEAKPDGKRASEAQLEKKPFKENLLETGPREKPPWEAEPGSADKIEPSPRTKARRAAARLRRQEGKGAGTKEINLQSVESMLKEIDAAPAPLRKKRTVAGIAEKPEETKNEPREATPDKGPALSLNTDQKNSPDANLNDILNETSEKEDSTVDEYGDDMYETYDSPEEIPGSEILPQAPLLDILEVDNALNRLFVNPEVAEKAESKTTRDEPPETVSQEPSGALDSKQSKIEGASESPLPVSADSKVPGPDSQQPDKPAQNSKKKGFFRKLFS